jgi:threonyl-tRNA synthetase
MEQFIMSEERYLEVARRMQLVHVGPSAGVVYWQPAGLRLYENLRSYIRGVHRRHGYLEVKSPSLVSLDLFERSGHLGKYREAMFLVNQANDGEAPANLQAYALRPMSCPNHIELYQSQRRSYRELPLNLFEFGEVFRNEPSGSLQVLFRQRQFCQDDSHVFAMDSQASSVVENYLVMAAQVYRDLGFESIEFAISLRPALRHGSDALWDRAEASLRQACVRAGVKWSESPGGGAFYGPKVELGVRDKLGRLWQMGVIQLDYVLPDRFEMRYQASSGEYAVPVILHHAVLGSLERMLGILLEVHGEALPDFLHPYPAVILPVSEKSAAYARAGLQQLRAHCEDAVMDDSNESLASRIRLWRDRGVARILVVGEQEAQCFAESGEAWAMLSVGRSKEAVRLSHPF